MSIPVGQLHHLKIPGVNTEDDEGSRVTVFDEATGSDEDPRVGHIVKLLSSVDPRGKMAQILVQVDDPLDVRLPVGERRLPSLLGSYVRVEMEGQALDEVVAVPRTALRDDGTVWVLDERQRLHARPVEVVHRARGRVLTRGLEDGTRVVVTPMAVASEGMKVEVEARTAEPARDDAREAPRPADGADRSSAAPAVAEVPSTAVPGAPRTAHVGDTPRK